MEHDVEKRYEFEWRGISIEIYYVQSFSKAYFDALGYPLSHLSIESVSPKRAPLPMTETGYLSDFIQGGNLGDYDNPCDYVKASLDHAAKSPEWIQHQASQNQMALF